jgi:hypothetical protein
MGSTIMSFGSLTAPARFALVPGGRVYVQTGASHRRACSCACWMGIVTIRTSSCRKAEDAKSTSLRTNMWPCPEWTSHASFKSGTGPIRYWPSSPGRTCCWQAGCGPLLVTGVLGYCILRRMVTVPLDQLVQAPRPSRGRL